MLAASIPGYWGLGSAKILPTPNAESASSVHRAEGTEIMRLDPALDVLFAPGAPVEKVAGDFKFTEGTVWRGDRLWFSDLVGNKIRAVTAEEQVELLIHKAGGYPNPPAGAYLGPNAMVTDKDGTVLLAQQGGRKIVRINDKM
jgi:gluconolactonase